MELFIKLLLAHLIGDFVLQPNKWVADKTKRKWRSGYLYVHILLHAALLLLLLGFQKQYFLVIIFIALTHGVIDVTKMLLQGKFNPRVLFFSDQLLHGIVLLAAVSWIQPGWVNWDIWNQPQVLLMITSFIMVTYVAAVVMRVLISKWNVVETNDSESLKDAGKYIGMLERALILCFLINNRWEAIGLLITAKSIFRFSDLSKAKDRKLTEYILVGTLLSFSIAIIVALFTQALMPLL